MDFTINKKYPLILSSGVVPNNKSFIFSLCNQYGADFITTKSATLFPNKGNSGETLVVRDGKTINNKGLPNPGIDAILKDIALKDFYHTIVSIHPENEKEVIEMAKKIDKFPVFAVELNVSCPNFGQLESNTIIQDFVSCFKEFCSKNLIVKLSPLGLDIPEKAFTAEKNGANAICIGNSLPYGMSINVHSGKPHIIGGISGSAIHELVTYHVWNTYEKVHIPIIATGGVTTTNDVAEFFRAGATAVGIGSEVMRSGPRFFESISTQLDLLEKEVGTLERVA